MGRKGQRKVGRSVGGGESKEERAKGQSKKIKQKETKWKKMTTEYTTCESSVVCREQ